MSYLKFILSFSALLFTTSIVNAQCTDNSPTGDCDSDGIINSLDLDDDNDGISDTTEYCSGTNFVWDESAVNGDLVVIFNSISGLSGTVTTTYTYTPSTGRPRYDNFPDYMRFSRNAGAKNTFGSQSIISFDQPVFSGSIRFTNIGSDNSTFDESQSVLFYFEGTQVNITPQVFNGGIWDAPNNTITGVNTSPTPQAEYEFTFTEPVDSFVVTSISVTGATGSEAYWDIRFNFDFCSIFTDADGDGIPSSLDLDSDNDDCPDALESGHNANFENDTIFGPYGNNGMADYLEVANESGIENYQLDTNSNGNPIFLDNNTVACAAFTANNDTAYTTENQEIDIDVINNDFSPSSQIDSSLVSVVNGSGPFNGTIQINDTTGLITYTPNINFFGTDSFIYSICDTGSPITCDTALVYIVVSEVNIAPNQGNETVVTNEDTELNNIDLDGNNSDPDNDPLTVSFPSGLTGSSGGTFVNNGDGTVNYTPPTNFNGNDSLIYQVCDNATPVNNCVTDTIFITVSPISDPPNKGNESVNTNTETPLSNIDLDNNNTDPDGDPVTVTFPNGLTGSSGGTFTDNGDGTVNYNPAPNFSGEEVLIYQVCDNETPVNNCVTDTLFITVTQSNIPPNQGNETINNDQNTELTNIDLDDNNTDPDGDQIIVVFSNGLIGSAGGIFTNNGDGTVNYEPSANTYSNDTLIYQVCDNALPDPKCVTDTIFILVPNAQDCDFEIPNVITLNEDGVNDVFNIPCLPFVYKSYELQIFNRWGKNIFTTEDINAGWKGETSNGNLVKAGTYYYIIKLNGEEERVTKTGHLTILK